MLLSKNVAELCALLVDEIFGELPSRILATLLSRGRLTLLQLTQATSLAPRQLRYGLAVLIQHNLLYHYVDPATKAAAYEAKPDAAYSLMRTGKILEIVESIVGHNGPEAREVMENILLAGQTRVADLREAYRDKMRLWKPAKERQETAPETANGNSAPKPNPEITSIKSLSHLDTILSRLVEADFLEVVTAWSFQSPQDIYQEVEKRIIAANFPGGARGTKQKLELQQKTLGSFEDMRAEAKSLKRKLEDAGARANKRQRIFVNGDVSNGTHHGRQDVTIEGRVVVRVNFEKCLIELRNRRLVEFAADRIGETTSRVYAVLLRLLSRSIHRCRRDPILDATGHSNGAAYPGDQAVTTKEILNHLNVSVDVSHGIGKASSSNVDRRLAENIRSQYPSENTRHGEAEVEGYASSDEADDSSEVSSDESVHEPRVNGMKGKLQVNGLLRPRVESQEHGPGRESRFDHLRQHLLLLCESKQEFVRHCDVNEWTVDFRPLIRTLQASELDIVIEHTSGRHGLRLARILREKGKLDEKSLPNIALMKKADVQNKMLEMQMAGFVDIQEVPRDNNRTASRTMFLWFSDSERCLDQLLENTYKAMLRTLQNLVVHRKRGRDVLDLAERRDVRGREEEIMETAAHNKFVRYKDVEAKLLGQIMRLDDLVAVLRDY